MYGFCKDKLTGEVGGHFLIWLLLVCTAEQGMIFRGLESQTGCTDVFTIWRLEQGAFLD